MKFGNGKKCAFPSAIVVYKYKEINYDHLGGDMLSIGNRYVVREKQELQRLGFKVYAPHDDKGINDKANAKQDKLAERIVANDTEVWNAVTL